MTEIADKDLVSIKDFIFNKNDVVTIEKIIDGYELAINIELINGKSKKISYKNSHIDVNQDFDKLRKAVSTVPLKEYCENMSIIISKIENVIASNDDKINKRMNAIVNMYEKNSELLSCISNKFEGLRRSLTEEVKQLKAARKLTNKKEN